MMLLILIALLSAVLYFSFILALRIGIGKLNDGLERKLAPICIIVAMKNEMRNVRSCLDALINQTYPKDLLEIIIADDGSTDETPAILSEYQKNYPFCRVIQIVSNPKSQSGKKYALSQAIDQGSGEILLFTDADCIPPPDWAYAMTSYFAPDVGLVAGFSPLFDPTDSVIGKLLLIDSLVNGAVAAGSIGLGDAVSCSGRNIAYRREVYNQVNGFKEIMSSVSGDDDLFLQLVHRKTEWKIRFGNDIDAIVPSYQTKTMKEFFSQKKRHLSAGKFYTLKLKVVYFLFHLSNLLLYLFFLISIISRQNIFLAALLLSAKFLSDALLIAAAGNYFKVQPNMKYFFLWEIFFVLYHLIIAPFSWLGRIRWK